MSCVESLTYAGSIMDLRDIDERDVDEIKLIENYKFKDSADISNNLQIAQFKEKVICVYFFNLIPSCFIY